MKQLLFAVTAASFLCFTACKPNHDEMKKQFMKNCEAGIKDQPDQVTKDAMHDYCACSADKIFASFTDDELITFNEMSEEDREKKIEPVVQPCLDELRQKTTQLTAPAVVPDSMQNAADTPITPATNN